jgi:hypothetical protein
MRTSLRCGSSTEVSILRVDANCSNTLEPDPDLEHRQQGQQSHLITKVDSSTATTQHLHKQGWLTNPTRRAGLPCIASGDPTAHHCPGCRRNTSAAHRGTHRRHDVGAGPSRHGRVCKVVTGQGPTTGCHTSYKTQVSDTTTGLGQFRADRHSGDSVQAQKGVSRMLTGRGGGVAGHEPTDRASRCLRVCPGRVHITLQQARHRGLEDVQRVA